MLRDVTAVAVIAWRASSFSVEITDTVEANRRMASRKAVAVCGKSAMVVSIIFANDNK